MYVFPFKYTEQQLERACSEFSEIQKTVDNQYCKGWDMKVGYNELNVTDYGDFYRVGDCYHGKILRSFRCSFEGNRITIYSAEENGRTFKAEKYLKKYDQCAMRIYALVMCGKLV